MVSSFLKDEGYKVDTAYDAAQAIKKILTNGYDLAILDYKLPDADGLSVLKDIRRIEPDIKVIMVSAYGSSDIKKAAKKQGVIKFLDKPFNLSGLTKIVKNAMPQTGLAGLTAPIYKKNKSGIRNERR